jgi:hypothetical protein
MCECQLRYCFGCGRYRVLIRPLAMCEECCTDWLRLTPARLRGREMTPEEAHA